jgi:hypothetical protein
VQGVPRQCYIMLRNLDEQGRITWATHVKRMLFQLVLGYNGVGSVKTFMQVFRTQVSDCCRQEIMSDINSSPKAISYRIYKTSISNKCYLSLSMPYAHKRALANFRCSGHDLKIETGRHLN